MRALAEFIMRGRAPARLWLGSVVATGLGVWPDVVSFFPFSIVLVFVFELDLFSDVCYFLLMHGEGDGCGLLWLATAGLEASRTPGSARPSGARGYAGGGARSPAHGTP